MAPTVQMKTVRYETQSGKPFKKKHPFARFFSSSNFSRQKTG
jgi:hypothetical protein